jgi:hypothetical protein
MPFQKGNKLGGRHKGSKPAVPAAVRISAKDRVDEVDAQLTAEGVGLAVQAKNNPAWFYEKIWVKILPKNMEVSGPGGGPIATRVEVALVAASQKNQG